MARSPVELSQAIVNGTITVMVPVFAGILWVLYQHGLQQATSSREISTIKANVDVVMSRTEHNDMLLRQYKAAHTLVMERRAARLDSRIESIEEYLRGTRNGRLLMKAEGKT